MSIKSSLLAAAAAVAFAMPALAADIEVQDPYARVSSMMSSSGAAFMIIRNHGDTDDHLVSATSDVAEKVELHTHEEDANGVMRMIHIEEGLALPADGEIEMVRGGNHVMFLGLNRELAQGDMVTVTLQFEKAGAITVEVPVDMERKPAHGHAGHGHGQMKKAD